MVESSKSITWTWTAHLNQPHLSSHSGSVLGSLIQDLCSSLPPLNMLVLTSWRCGIEQKNTLLAHYLWWQKVEDALDASQALLVQTMKTFFLARAISLNPELKGSTFLLCRQSLCQYLNGRNDYPNHSALQSPPSKQATLIVWLLWYMDCLNEVICHRGVKNRSITRAIIYSSKLIGEAYWGNRCVRVWISKCESEVYPLNSHHRLQLWSLC